MSRNGTFYDRDRDRWYRDPLNPTKSYAGVTSVLDARNKKGITNAKINGLAKYVAANRAHLASIKTQAGVVALLKEQDEYLPDWRIARDLGTATHRVIENIIEGRATDDGVSVVEGSDTYPILEQPTVWAPKWWDEFTSENDVEIIDVEQTVISEEHAYGGSFDLCVRLNGKITLLDAKTNKGGPHGDVSLQNTAYSRAGEIIDMNTGARREMHRVEQSKVLWMRPEGWALHPLSLDEHTWRYFYALLLTFQYGKIESDMVLDPVNSNPLRFRRWGK